LHYILRDTWFCVSDTSSEMEASLTVLDGEAKQDSG
jgi:hypothetical protein